MAILVTGATGNIGGEVVQHLLEKHASIRGLVRDPSKATKLANRVELAIGDLSQPETLDAALQGIERAFLVCLICQTKWHWNVALLMRLSEQAFTTSSNYQSWERVNCQAPFSNGIAKLKNI